MSQPRAPRYRLVLGSIFGSLMLAAALQADDRAPDSPAPPVVYVPPDLGAPKTRSVGAVRGTSADAALQVLAPERTGRTLRTQPVLYWYLPQPSERPVELTLIDEQSVDPLLELELEPPVEAGIHDLSLVDHGIELQPGETYWWSVAQVLDPEQRSADVVASTALEVAPEPSLLAQIESGPADARVAKLAEAGYWLDAVDLLSRRIGQTGDAEARRVRAFLLEEEALPVVAAYDRAALQ